MKTLTHKPESLEMECAQGEVSASGHRAPASFDKHPNSH